MLALGCGVCVKKLISLRSGGAHWCMGDSFVLHPGPHQHDQQQLGRPLSVVTHPPTRVTPLSDVTTVINFTLSP